MKSYEKNLLIDKYHRNQQENFVRNDSLSEPAEL